ncbi:MAG TPA: hypothetical protein VM942_10930 [Acidimicrobiales bacterium]|nr:hypothetical protein [Acidimicrobiales bacterium]
MTPSEERFRAKVRRQGSHEVWSGARDARGTGLVRIDGTLRTVQRAAWEFAHGPLPPGARVLACSEERACVHLGHLRLDRPQRATPPRRQRRTGSKREVKPGVWELAVSLGAGPDGRTRRRYRTINGREEDADIALADLAETANGPTRLGDLRVRELLDRYLTWLDDGSATAPIESYRKIADTVIEPACGRDFAAILDTADVDDLLRTAYRGGASPQELREILALLTETYRWARGRRWTTRNPTADTRVRDIVG